MYEDWVREMWAVTKSGLTGIVNQLRSAHGERKGLSPGFGENASSVYMGYRRVTGGENRLTQQSLRTKHCLGKSTLQSDLDGGSNAGPAWIGRKA